MTLLCETPIPTQTYAQNLAADNWVANRQALRCTQPNVAEQLDPIDPDLEWVLGSDGTLTARMADGRWFADCSLPLLAGRALLKSLEASMLGSCLLTPNHAGLLLASREQIGPHSVLIVLHPDAQVVRIILGCHNFSADIKSHRLWFACGDAWETGLRRIFHEHPGLATSHRFIRTKLIAPEIADPLITAAQAVFSAVLANRTKAIADLQACKPVPSDQILLVGSSQFRLWDDGSFVLQAELLTASASATPITTQRFNMDEPLSTSPLALAQAARTCGCVVSANVCRADSNNLVPIETPWITWMTRPGAPPLSTAGPCDSLILADDNWRPIARNAGWLDHRVHVCAWPKSPNPAKTPSTKSNRQPVLGVLCDTLTLEVPKSIEEFSSHAILWEMIETELLANPLVVENVDHYLRNRAEQLNIDPETLDRPRFIDCLITPAYQQGLARLLIGAGIPVQIWGNGWPLLAEFSNHSNGPLTSREDLAAVLAGSTALLYCWPTRVAHPIDATGKPVLTRDGREPALFIRDAKRILAMSTPPEVNVASRNQLGRLVIDCIQQSRG